MKLFDKILIANRGEIAVRIIKTAKRLGISAVAVFAEDDANSLHVELANEAILLEGDTLGDTYLNQNKIIQLAKETNSQAIHPGYGFLSENSDFAKSVEDEGLVFIGATPAQISLMGEKSQAFDLVKELNIPLIPGLHGTVSDIINQSESFSFPIMIKASSGGGGKGMQIVNSEDELAAALQKAQRQATEYFGKGDVFVEKYLPNARHIEVQVFGDGKGNAVHLFERECSIQRRYQKLIEEAPANSISKKLKDSLYETSVKIAQHIKYRGAGTIEFMVDQEENYYFLEMNTRLQVEHPVTEFITGFDLVEWQLLVAAGEKLPKLQNEITCSGHAIEMRLCVEDPLADFQPVSGKIEQLFVPNNCRFDSFLKEGIELSSNYDSLLGKLIGTGNNRSEATKDILSSSEKIMIPGIKTNLEFLREIVKSKNFIQNKIDTSFVENRLEEIKKEILYERDKASFVIPALSYYIYHFLTITDAESVWTQMGHFRIYDELIIEVDNVPNQVSFKKETDGWDFTINGESLSIRDICCEGNLIVFHVNDVEFNVLVASQGGQTWIQVDGYSFKARSNHLLDEAHVVKEHNRKDSGQVHNITADLFGKVIRVHVQAGDNIAINQPLLTIESMKTEFKILSPSEGLIKQLHVETGSVVQDKQLLIEFEPKNKKPVSI